MRRTVQPCRAQSSFVNPFTCHWEPLIFKLQGISDIGPRQPSLSCSFNIMDPPYASDDEDGAAAAAAMAAAMGFSSFGTQSNPIKKRKFNAATDAFVEGQELSSLDRGGKKGQGSGGNNIPLGKQRVIGTAAAKSTSKSNMEEIDLDGDEDDYAPGGGGQEEEEEEEAGPNYIDTSLPPPIEDLKDKQDRIDRVLANIRPELQGAQLLHELPQRPAATAAAHSHQRNGGRGQRNELWYVGYYDASFNENPWARLEKERGLEPVGSWIERPGPGSGASRRIEA
ncbi:hypothetical protein PVAG01_01702 [Phlyctema vagabunda]|uniref:Uncharacterized protein n=1 Tax=Phlyctema vagabunda TaxID=108571 RepID=A0ABR4PXX0_9HELO